MAVVIGDLADDEELKDWFNQRDASDSGVGELRKMSKSGTHASIFVCGTQHKDLCLGLGGFSLGRWREFQSSSNPRESCGI